MKYTLYNGLDQTYTVSARGHDNITDPKMFSNPLVSLRITPSARQRIIAKLNPRGMGIFVRIHGKQRQVQL